VELTVARVASLLGDIRPPSDKSITHRSFLFGAIAEGKSVVRSPLLGEDCVSTLRCLAQMGLDYRIVDDSLVELNPALEWRQPDRSLDCGNSGTTMRLLSGLVAGRPLDVTMVGDASLSRRPMKRIADPLRLMGATVEGDTPPLHIKGGDLTGITYQTPVASAQIKSCVLLAGLRAQGETWVEEPSQSRDHTERMLRGAGVELLGEGTRVGVRGGARLNRFDWTVPGDISSAAFFMVGAAIVPGSRVGLKEVSLNPTRTGILDVFQQCEADISIANEREDFGEAVGDIQVRFRPGIHYRPGLRPFRIEGELVPRLIDEIPVLAVLASQCDGISEIRDAGELRVKESDRIDLIAAGLRAMGVKVETFSDAMNIHGPVALRGAAIDAHGDHRIAMAFAIAGLIAEGTTTISNAEAISTSFPSFEEELEHLIVV
jgi:3-phosphoshikimate 1-carboxyvinyltransferase